MWGHRYKTLNTPTVKVIYIGAPNKHCTRNKPIPHSLFSPGWHKRMVTQLNQWKQQNFGTDRWNTLFQLNPKTSSFYDTSNLPHDSGFNCHKNPLKQLQNIILLLIEGVIIVGHDYLISSTKSSSNHRACHSRLIGRGAKPSSQSI